MSNSADSLCPGGPSSLGGYRIRERLGRGGMGTAHLAHDPAGRAVALKLIHPHLADDEDEDPEPVPKEYVDGVLVQEQPILYDRGQSNDPLRILYESYHLHEIRD